MCPAMPSSAKTKLTKFNGLACEYQPFFRQVCSWGFQGCSWGCTELKGCMEGGPLLSLSWNDVVSRAVDVARDGFNVSHSLATAISKLETEKIEGRFRDIFIPDGQALRLGSYLKMPDLADVLRAGLRNFYRGAISQEIEQEVMSVLEGPAL
ncbi:hypothetical protein XENOCAPTIV_013955 [Xenoophorus captivus]|uniref:Uncharacterized protein n=1 Tax=Xenoophorus captivus TaxID=1517983 RepID=A0ABV0S7P0_9TELE